MVGSRTGDRIRREIDPATPIGAVLPLAALVISLSSWPTQALKSLAVGVAGLGPLIMAIGLGGRFSFLVQVRANVLFVFLWIALIVLLWERNRDGAVALLAVPPSSVVVVRLLPWGVRRLLSDVDFASHSEPTPGLG